MSFARPSVAATLPAVSDASEVASTPCMSPEEAICWPFLSTRKTIFALESTCRRWSVSLICWYSSSYITRSGVAICFFYPSSRKDAGPRNVTQVGTSLREGTGALDPGHAGDELGVPLLPPRRLAHSVLGVAPPVGDGLLAFPVRDSDAEAVRPARTLHAEERPLLRRQLDHAIGRGAIPVIDLGAAGGEDDGVIGRRRCLR